MAGYASGARELKDVLKAAEERYEREASMRQKLAAGEISYDLHKLRDIVDKNMRKP